jgi:glycine betaine catabolism B
MAEVWHWLQDVSEHLRVARQRKALRAPGQGVDHVARWDQVQAAVERLHPRRMRLRVVEVIQATPSAKTYRLERTDGPLPPFRAGQYVNVFLDVDGVPTSRPYSIASHPGENVLEMTIKDKPGGFVAPYVLNQVGVGDELETTGPSGGFYHEPLIDGEDLVFLAGGSGITPFMSIIRDAVCRGFPLKVHLLYGCRVPEDIIYGDELATLAAEHPGLQYTLVISEPPPGYTGPAGFLDAALIRDRVGEVADKTFYICGPNLMYDLCLAALEALGVSRHKIKRELYGPPSDVTREPGWPAGLAPDAQFAVEVVGRQTVRAAAGEPLLNSLERYGIVVPAVCRAGECSACRIQLLAGRVFMPAQAGVREADREHGYIHACVSYPLEDLRIRV